MEPLRRCEEEEEEEEEEELEGDVARVAEKGAYEEQKRRTRRLGKSARITSAAKPNTKRKGNDKWESSKKVA